jgi:hypothetical protein
VLEKFQQVNCNSVTRTWKHKEIFEQKCICIQSCVWYMTLWDL